MLNIDLEDLLLRIVGESRVTWVLDETAEGMDDGEESVKGDTAKGEEGFAFMGMVLGVFEWGVDMVSSSSSLK